MEDKHEQLYLEKTNSKNNKMVGRYSRYLQKNGV